MALRAEEDEAVAVLPDAAAGMDQDVVADQRGLNRGIARRHCSPGRSGRRRRSPRPNRSPFRRRSRRPGRSPPADRRSRRLPDAPSDRSRRTARCRHCRTRIAGEARRLYNSRAIFTNSRNGCAARSTATWAGTLASKRGLTRHAPALVDASWSAYFRLSKNARCIGPASSSEASPLTAWPPREAIDQMRLRQRGDFGQRRRRRLLEKCRLRHSTRRGPAGDRKSGSDQSNRSPACASVTRTESASLKP